MRWSRASAEKDLERAFRLIAQAIMAVAQIMLDLPEIAELDINPLSVDASGAVALYSTLRRIAAGVWH